VARPSSTGTPLRRRSFAWLSDQFPVADFSKANSDLKSPEPAVFSFADYAAGAGEKLHVSTFEEGFRNRQNRQRPHRHDFYQIFWMMQGAPSFNLDFDHLSIEAHALVFVPPGAVHTFGARNSADGFILSFQEDFLESEGHSVDLFAECPALDPAQIRTLLAVPESSVEIVHGYCRRMFEEFNAKREGYRSATAALLRLLFVEIRRCLSHQPSPSSFHKYSSLTARFLRTLSARPYQVTTASEVARLLGVSRSWLNQLVRQETAKNLTDHLQGRLILESKRLLAHSDLNVSEVAYQLGFEDPSYFTRLFRQMEGLSPREFRDEYR
jgi:AraC family transcriptional regulator, transcriptional activator of pobA